MCGLVFKQQPVCSDCCCSLSLWYINIIKTVLKGLSVWVSISAHLHPNRDNSDDALIQGYTLMGAHVNPESRGGSYQLLQVSHNSRISQEIAEISRKKPFLSVKPALLISLIYWAPHVSSRQRSGFIFKYQVKITPKVFPQSNRIQNSWCCISVVAPIWLPLTGPFYYWSCWIGIILTKNILS